MKLEKIDRTSRDKHFDTETVKSDLGTRSVQGGAAVFAGQVLRFVIQTSSTMVLARLLTPADFGLIAMVTGITGFISHFKDLGLTMATVQRADVTHAQASKLFWINLVFSVALALIGIALAPLVASFYGEPSLKSVMAAVSTTFLFSGVAAQHLALLRRQMRFGIVSIIEVIALVLAVAAAVTAARLGAGYWALVILIVVEATMGGALTMLASGWRPGLPRRGVDVGSMLRYGVNVSGFNILTYIGRAADTVLIGRFWGSGPTGLYSKAYGLLMLPLTQINTPINSVAIPVLSRLQGDSKRYCAYYYQALSLVAYLTAPLILFLAATADDVIAIVLGPQWERSATIFRFLAIAALFQPVLYTAGWVWLSLGRTRTLFRWSTVTAPTFVLSFAIGLPWGPEGVALAYAVAVNLLTPVGLAWAYRDSGLSLRGAVRVISRPYLLGALVFLSCLATKPLFENAMLLVRLTMVSIVALTVCIAFALLYPAARKELIRIIELGKRLRRPTGIEG
jgi:O-antigen/teichoic acid export membrane protein